MTAPAFYCENCGRKVPAGLASCPGCRQEFDSVRCPVCGFTGSSEEFKSRCPDCGYTGVTEFSTETNKKIKKQFSPLLYKILIVVLVITLFILIRLYFML
jgi:predicted RNA-binding Zn-ribbon protein involved in translation (DUF1610 family)